METFAWACLGGCNVAFSLLSKSANSSSIYLPTNTRISLKQIILNVHRGTDQTLSSLLLLYPNHNDKCCFPYAVHLVTSYSTPNSIYLLLQHNHDAKHNFFFFAGKKAQSFTLMVRGSAFLQF
jgi:hypothetical protein